MTKKFSFVLAFAVFLTFNLAGLFAGIPTNAAASRQQDSLHRFLYTFAPQNWAYFTKDPESSELIVVDGDSLQSLMRTPQNRPSNYFGISRNQRAQGPEVAMLVSEIPDDKWRDCVDNFSSCLKDAQKITPEEIRNTSSLQTICGDVIITLSHITPWSYRSLTTDEHRIEKAAKVRVICDD
ncbi:SdpA family antimicrobial peptide system protein [Corynebacterium sp. CCM 9185]|uniref:SdpA family antimicrobial peptide system protein n=1 Tax=Corynebacterium marambiense TaxID=2765364 RepID=A0ABS0VU71_9CORY|nr:SdpA family antimicrobial peptide system protein [Corynebacterium marambiense]MBI9000299.1 SdpA family antimicrobial peptide system protein [Corynebacterium marambiense]MCK7663654.1 SdpA family antimicrobial peptide system protein [Corynebacterium marambiense]